MSSQRGNVSRTRAQKHKNRFVFKNDLHDKTPQQIKLNAMHVATVCQRCKEQIEWKIKYKKYKPLSQAKTCAHCKERTVKKAYHVICRDCSVKARVCAKCLKSGEEVAIEEAGPTPREEQQLQSEMDRLVKSFSERKRRAFLRYMKKGKKQPVEEKGEQDLLEDEKVKRVAHTRDELLDKIKQLNLAEEDDDDDYDDDEDEDDYSGEEDDSELDSEEEDSQEETKHKSAKEIPPKAK